MHAKIPVDHGYVDPCGLQPSLNKRTNEKTKKAEALEKTIK